MELERACRETRDVKREREVALTEVDILRDRLHRDRQRIKEIRNELLRIDYTTPPEEITMTAEELVLELRRAVRAADLERDHYESRIDEYEAAALQHRLERQELLDKHVQMRRVVHKMTQDMASQHGTPSSPGSPTDKSNSSTVHGTPRGSTRSQRFSVNTDTFFRTLFHRRPKIPDFDVSTSDYVEGNSQDMSHLSAASPPDDEGRSTNGTASAAAAANGSTTTKRKSGLKKKVVRALRGNGTARPYSTETIRRISRAFRRRGRKGAVADEEIERSPSPGRAHHPHRHDDEHAFYNDTIEMPHDKSFSDQQNSMTLTSTDHPDISILDASVLPPVEVDPTTATATTTTTTSAVTSDQAHSPKLKNKRSFLGTSDASLSPTIKRAGIMPRGYVRYQLCPIYFDDEAEIRNKQ
ncbi:hypothetical protein SYNPS1DRAFT_28412 [Syncephalis pseudoplumigaleata]|uniref:Uncharacterized protein n=1 Tax=Syncephalis pseudoplumigaleata TaxID=1712513 RepID=A0A4P9Z095_9FUNG|nr:hypothetical protein SYNPS1DRAFT_28412 [Syncephalis pseudoplumigaleata]|eukprot:RKP25867.1 hypothetical protein SYNPS1DRAFT_28412 [Syncephalis pseudoplumigaleata]